MRTKLAILLRIPSLIVGMLLAFVPCAYPQKVPEMLERALPGVVTVAVNETSDDPTKRVMGMAGSRPDRLSKAYDRVLDLSDAKGTGSGFLIRVGGRQLIVTNVHVVEMAKPDEIYAYSINQTKYRLRWIGGDTFYDIALLEFDEPSRPGPELVALEFRADDPPVGETVYALGNPLGQYPYSVSQGIIGGRNRLLTGLTGRLGYLQHSASLIWGNSGGPLIDSQGLVVGVNTRIEISDHGQAFLISQLNFSLEASVAKRVINGLLENNGRLKRAYLGLELTQTVAINQFRKSVVTEAIIDDVVSDSPAAQLAQFRGFRIDRIGVSAIRNLDEAMAAIEDIRPGETVEFEVSKERSTQTVKIRAGTLNEEAYRALVQQVLHKKLNLQVLETDGHVALERSGSSKNVSNVQSLKLSQTGSRPAGPMPQGATVVAVGFVPNTPNQHEEPLLYRVSSATDLGVSLRLLLMSGRADFVVAQGGSDESIVLRWTLSQNADALVRMLIC